MWGGCNYCLAGRVARAGTAHLGDLILRPGVDALDMRSDQLCFAHERSECRVHQGVWRELDAQTYLWVETHEELERKDAFPVQGRFRLPA